MRTAKTSVLIRELLETQRPEFVSFTYTAKTSGERARHLINIGVPMETIYRNSVAAVEGALPGLNGVDKIAAEALLETWNVSLAVGIGNHPKNVNKETYEHVGGLLIHRETGEVYVHAQAVSRKVLEKGTPRAKSSNPLVLAKDAIRYQTPVGKIRQFDLGLVETAKMHGKVLVLSTSRK